MRETSRSPTASRRHEARQANPEPAHKALNDLRREVADVRMNQRLATSIVPHKTENTDLCARRSPGPRSEAAH
jgi:hypothetical protein